MFIILFDIVCVLIDKYKLCKGWGLIVFVFLCFYVECFCYSCNIIFLGIVVVVNRSGEMFIR